ncbi:MFS transporter [Dermacoccus nishinomiyaensis]|uniref:MFS transporter n=1 Tax=Dermacoccus TaxID=57495 RepID=UPI0010ACA8DC|nr:MULTISPECIES: MFS transporter [Dermacoccus]TJZ96875.1 MFS transporter [Dermacoccus nishinomiyaensis]
MTSIKGRSAFSLWFAGETVSQLGTSLAMLGWTLLAYSVTHDVRAAALVGALRTATQIVTVLPGGLISDRLDRRSLLLLDAGVEVLLYGVLAAFIVTDVLSLGLLAALAVIQGACSGALGSVRHTVLPDLVEEDELGEAVARMQTRDAVIATLGPPLGGVLYGIAPVVPFMSNVVLSAMEWAFTTRLPRRLGTLDPERPTEPLRPRCSQGSGGCGVRARPRRSCYSGSSGTARSSHSPSGSTCTCRQRGRAPGVWVWWTASPESASCWAGCSPTGSWYAGRLVNS